MDDLANKLDEKMNSILQDTLDTNVSNVIESLKKEEQENETLRKNILECYVSSMAFDGWEIEENSNGGIIVYEDDGSHSFASYKEGLEYYKDNIMSDVDDGLLDHDGYYDFYLSKEQLSFLGLESEYEEQTQSMKIGINPDDIEISELVQEDADKQSTEPSTTLDEQRNSLVNRYKNGFKTEQEKDDFIKDWFNQYMNEELDKSKKTPVEATVKNIMKNVNKTKDNKSKEGNNLSYDEVAKQIDQKLSIVEIAKELGFNLKPNGRGYWTTNEHSSLVIDEKKNAFFWNSRNINGGVVKMWRQFKDRSFPDAVKDLRGRISDKDFVIKNDERNVQKELSPLERHKNLNQQLHENNLITKKEDMRHTRAYLIKTRQIDPEIVDKMIDEKLLFQTVDDKGRTYATFVGKDENGYICSVCKRSTSTQFKLRGDFSGCNYKRGWFYDPQFDLNTRLYDKSQMPNSNKPLLVFESSIEMMSYMSLLKATGKDYNNYAYLSCGGTSKNKSVLETCKTYGYKKAFIMFNNDREKGENNPGLNYSIMVADNLTKNGVDAKPLVPSKANDWNDTLIAYKNHQIELSSYNVKKNKSAVADKIVNLKNKSIDFNSERPREKGIER